MNAAYWWTRADKALHAAKLLNGQGGLEESVVQDSYYSVYYGMRAALEQLGFDTADSNRHGKILSEFNRQYVLAGKADRVTMEDVNMLITSRKFGDYSADVFYSEDEAREAIQAAERFHQFTRHIRDRVPPDPTDPAP